MITFFFLSFSAPFVSVPKQQCKPFPVVIAWCVGSASSRPSKWPYLRDCCHCAASFVVPRSSDSSSWLQATGRSPPAVPAIATITNSKNSRQPFLQHLMPTSFQSLVTSVSVLENRTSVIPMPMPLRFLGRISGSESPLSDLRLSYLYQKRKNSNSSTLFRNRNKFSVQILEILTTSGLKKMTWKQNLKPKIR